VPIERPARRRVDVVDNKEKLAMNDTDRNGLRGMDKTGGDRRNPGSDRDTPDGATRPRKGPLDKDAGLRAQIESATEQPASPGQPAGGE
jgi:hypothetical protein